MGLTYPENSTDCPTSALSSHFLPESCARGGHKAKLANRDQQRSSAYTFTSHDHHLLSVTSPMNGSKEKHARHGSPQPGWNHAGARGYSVPIQSRKKCSNDGRSWTTCLDCLGVLNTFCSPEQALSC